MFSCKQLKKEELTIHDIEIFENTPAWELAKAVEDEDVSKIKDILISNPKLMNYEEPVYGMNLLIRAIGTEKYNSVKQLLESGTNPNAITPYGTTALFEAVGYSWYDTRANKDHKFVKLLLDYKADPNINYCSPKSIIKGETDPIPCGTSPLMHSISRGIEKTKLLVKNGAKINYKTETGSTAAIEALMYKDVEAAYYLIVVTVQSLLVNKICFSC